MLIKITNKYTKDCYSHYEKRCDEYYIKKDDILSISKELGKDIESYWTDRQKENYYVYVKENDKTKKIQIDYDSFRMLQEIL